jgi:hypothetical protein
LFINGHRKLQCTNQASVFPCKMRDATENYLIVFPFFYFSYYDTWFLVSYIENSLLACSDLVMSWVINCGLPWEPTLINDFEFIGNQVMNCEQKSYELREMYLVHSLGISCLHFLFFFNLCIYMCCFVFLCMCDLVFNSVDRRKNVSICGWKVLDVWDVK